MPLAQKYIIYVFLFRDPQQEANLVANVASTFAIMNFKKAAICHVLASPIPAHQKEQCGCFWAPSLNLLFTAHFSEPIDHKAQSSLHVISRQFLIQILACLAAAWLLYHVSSAGQWPKRSLRAKPQVMLVHHWLTGSTKKGDWKQFFYTSNLCGA